MRIVRKPTTPAREFRSLAHGTLFTFQKTPPPAPLVFIKLRGTGVFGANYASVADGEQGVADEDSLVTVINGKFVEE